MRCFRPNRGGINLWRTAYRRICLHFVLISLLFLLPALSSGQTKRVVIVKVDGLPPDLVDQFVNERDQRTGKSELPWIDHIFYQRGARLKNFYVRGMSLSAPSWSTLDTGQHLQIKGNVEFDRYTLHTYDYLNFIPFYFKSAARARIDMPGVEVLDSVRVPLLVDAFPHEDRYIGFQLYQRGMRFATLREALQKHFLKPPRELLDEWTLGMEMRTPFYDQMELELREKLNNPRVRYLDIYVGNFDHVAHHNRDRQSHLVAVQQIDALIGRISTAIQKAPLADETALIMVSDHGVNTDEKIYSQGYNLVKLLGSRSGGGHHVVTKRRLMLDYSLKGINFLVPLITTTTNDSFYLKGQSTNYPTALLDFDGNERASIHLRDSDFNLLQILLQQLQDNKLAPAVRSAATEAFFETIEARRSQWLKTVDELDEELVVLRKRIEEQRKLWEAQPKKFSLPEIEVGRDDQKTRIYAQLEKWTTREKEYTEYIRTLRNLLALLRENFKPATVKIENVIAKHAMGERNSIHQLQNYIAGPSPGGFVLNADGSLNTDKSFLRVDYFSLLNNVSMKNNVQPLVSNKPIDMIVTRISSDLVKPLVRESVLSPDVVLVYGGVDKQALILARENDKGVLSFRYQPIKNVKQAANGEIHFEPANWEAGFPLRIFEDNDLAVPPAERAAWLSEWHTDEEWLRVLHKTKYSNGLVGLHEEIARHAIETLSDKPGLSNEERLMRRFLRRQRELIETDLLLVANDHWNFDVRGFNPGGNHGSFFRISTHSTLMMAGGSKTGIPQAAIIDEPYDALSFVPTVLALTGNLRDDNNPVSSLWDKGFRRFPGRPIKEVLAKPSHKIATTGAATSP
ncbi:MAG: alkaline phosphatase family protein [Acidobacteriota bacterium]|nr:alkaline phosphatase family protein [Acidobacteriota bacterium]